MKKKQFQCYLALILMCGGLMGFTDAPPLQAKFIGNEAFHITDGEYVLMTDFPYVSGAYGYMTYDYNFPQTTGNILSLISHRHDDHFAPMLFLEQGWNIIGPLEVTQVLAQNKVLALGEEIAFGPIKIMPKKTLHGNTEHYSYLVSWHGRNLFFTGDTQEIDLFQGLPDLDALFISPWLFRSAKMNDALPNTKKIIIYHHTENEIVPNCDGCLIPTQNQTIKLD